MFAFTVCLVLVITSAGNFKVSAAEAEQYEPSTLERGCPTTQVGLGIVESEILRDIGTRIEGVEHQVGTYTCNGTPGWSRVAYIDMTNSTHNCPNGLRFTSYFKRTCGRLELGTDCSSTTFSTKGSQYSQVCGRIIGYQVGYNAAFRTYISESTTVTINDIYVDGVSLTHGQQQRQHIWTFASGASETDQTSDVSCTCDVSLATSSGNVPPFVGTDFFCESGTDEEPNNGQVYGSDPLWDGQGCSSTSTCCEFNNPPWFTKNLPNPTTDDIELRLCTSAVNFPNDDTAVELIELYVQ